MVSYHIEWVDPFAQLPFLSSTQKQFLKGDHVSSERRLVFRIAAPKSHLKSLN
jgi:hypothetical protein